MILIIDNYDSFTYNLYQAVAITANLVQVARNDEITIRQIQELKPSGIILSPGPGYPDKAGICIDVIKQLGQSIPILGVCLGHQAIGMAFGGAINRATHAMHGKQTLLFHNRSLLFNGITLPFQAGRYHSLIVEKISIPTDLKIDALDAQGNIMALSHIKYPIFGVQFHPESILTPEGDHILKNFLNFCQKFGNGL
ncbi:MAG: aminodeoxychorismate/anthranilate synthase component [Burkholderiales bacterium]|jgi:anthranilate synthase component 2|nr:aminodeoxychorismate/anthranilate synthase component [Burkholderiales bacterium]